MKGTQDFKTPMINSVLPGAPARFRLGADSDVEPHAGEEKASTPKVLSYLSLPKPFGSFPKQGDPNI